MNNKFTTSFPKFDFKEFEEKYSRNKFDDYINNKLAPWCIQMVFAANIGVILIILADIFNNC